jgi:putative flippase GtrA
MSLRALAPQIAKFLVAGGIAASANIATGWALRRLFEGEGAHAAAVAAGYCVGTVVSFVLNRKFTFQATEGNLRRQIIRYAWATLGGIVVAALIAAGLEVPLRSLLATRLTSAQIGDVAHVGAIGFTTIYSFLVIKYFALRVEERARPEGLE